MALQSGVFPGNSGLESDDGSGPVVADVQDEIVLVFEAEQLVLPRLPGHLRERCLARGEWQFSTRDDLGSLYDLEPLAAQFRSADASLALVDYAALGYSGHGFSSWAFSYALVEQGLGLFFQVAWNGPDTDDAKGRQRIANLAMWSDRLGESFHEARREGHVPQDSRLLVVDCSFGGRYWGWVTPTSFQQHSTLNPQYDAWKSLQSLLNL